MNNFKISKSGIKQIKNKIALLFIPLMIISGAIGLYIGDSSSGNNDIIYYIIPFMILVLSLSAFVSVKKQGKILESFEVSIDKNSISRRQDGLQEISINKEEINSVIINGKGHIIIKADSKKEIIGIPRTVENKEELIRLLSNFSEIEYADSTKGKNTRKIVIILSLTLGLLVLFATTFISENKILVLICGSITIVCLIALKIYIQMSKIIDKKTKRKSWLSIFIIIMLIGKMYQTYYL